LCADHDLAVGRRRPDKPQVNQSPSNRHVRSPLRKSSCSC
jgi:hypothetical protein